MTNSNGGGIQQQHNNCSTELTNLISLNNAVIINQNQNNQDVNNNEHEARIATHRTSNNVNTNDQDDAELANIEPTFFDNNDGEDPFELNLN